MTPAVGINSNGIVVEVHQSQGLSTGLWYWIGRVAGTEIEWAGHDTIKNDEGYRPSVGVNASGVVFEVHDSGHGTLWYWIGQVSGTSVSWGGHAKYDNGTDPAVALNDGGLLFGSHNSGHGTLWYRVGQVSDGAVSWTDHDKYDDGVTPAVAINNSGQVIEVHDSGHGTLWYRIGQISSDGKLTWLGHSKYDDGCNPAVALTDSGYVIEVHQSSPVKPYLWQRIGQIDGSSIIWLDWFGQDSRSYYFDYGQTPSVSFANGQAVQVHQSGTDTGLFSTASLWFDRGNWMGNNLTTLGDLSLPALVIPATHDSGMYEGGLSLSTLGKAQDLNLYGQLLSGVRYFDLRPANKSGTLIVYHGAWDSILHVDGPNLSDILADVQKFMQAGGKELVILKFSHFGGFDQPTFETMCNMINQYLGSWLYTGTRPSSLPRNSWLSGQTLNTYVSGGGACLVVCDGSYTPPASLTNAIWVYRDWFATDPQDGDLTVFDIYSNTIDLDTMESGTGPNPDPNLPGLEQGQLPKFAAFNGNCYYNYDNNTVVCGLFLLSWTLTPPTAIWPFSRTANAAVGPAAAEIATNPANRVVNLLYVDYTEYARTCDIAFIRNGLVSASSNSASASQHGKTSRSE